jgi:uncharacterized protein
MRPEPLTIDGPAGGLEARWLPPPAPDPRVAVVCHPHPQHGGSMDSKVVTTLVRSLHLAGLGVLHFNFRGVGASEGVYDEGDGEMEDLAAAVAHLRAAGSDRVWLAGFSFGAWICTRMAARLGVEALISIAPPVQRLGFERLDVPRCRWLIVQGEDDDLVDAEAVAAWVGELPVQPHLIRLEGVDHFFHGKLRLLRETLLRTLEAWDDQEDR